MEFVVDAVVYMLAVSNTNESIGNESLFTAFTQAVRRKKGLFFYKNVDAVAELKNFSQIVSKAAEKNGFENH